MRVIEVILWVVGRHEISAFHAPAQVPFLEVIGKRPPAAPKVWFVAEQPFERPRRAGRVIKAGGQVSYVRLASMI
jgi:hypothetical protein